MKFLVAVCLSSFAFGALAQEDLANMKKMANEHLDKKITRLQEAKKCVSDAASMESYKVCKYDLHEDMQTMKREMKEGKDEPTDG